MVKEIHVRVARDLTQRALKFSDLNPSEQQALVEQVHSDLLREGDDSVSNLEKAVNSVCDTEIAAEVRRIKPAKQDQDGDQSPRVEGGEPAKKQEDEATSASKIVEVATSAVIALLEQLPPEHRALTRLMLGQPFPEVRAGNAIFVVVI